MLDSQRKQAIELLVENNHTRSEMAKICGVSRTGFYRWLAEPEFIKEWDKQVSLVKETASRQITTSLGKYVTEIQKLAYTAESESVRKDALIYLTNRVLGVPTSKQELLVSSDEGDVAQREKFLQLLQTNNISMSKPVDYTIEDDKDIVDVEQTQET